MVNIDLEFFVSTYFSYPIFIINKHFRKNYFSVCVDGDILNIRFNI